MTDPVRALEQMARQPVGSGHMHLSARDIEAGVQAVTRRSHRPGSGMRQLGGGVSYAARPIGEFVGGVIIEGERQLREHCMRSAPHLRR